MANPFTFVNWGVLGVTDKGSRGADMPGYNVIIWEECEYKGKGYYYAAGKDWSSTLAQTLGRREDPDFIENKKTLGYATPTEAKQFFKTMIYRIERHNETTPLKVNKIRFLKKFSREPNWENLEMGVICYSWFEGKHRWGHNLNHRAIIYFQPVMPKRFKEEVEELDYTNYGL